MSQPALYRFEQVEKRYGGRTVLQLPALTIWPGEVWGLIGPSGAGKSTLLRLLAFLERPSAGCIYFNGRQTDDNWPDLTNRRRATMVFQRPQLLHRSVYDNVGYGLRLREGRLEKADQRVLDMLERLGLLPLQSAPAGTLSGGELQRVALARALVIEPDILLLDEPTANLDPGNIGRIEAMIGAVAQDRETTIIMVTHNVFQARRVAQNVALLLEGRLVERGSVEQMFNRPERPETAAFIRGDIIY